VVRHIVNGAPTRAFTVSPSNSSDLPHVTLGILLSATGDVAVIMADDLDTDTFVLTDLAGGVVHPLRIRRILATGTDAITIVGLY
jgi:hypothetical protein